MYNSHVNGVEKVNHLPDFDSLLDLVGLTFSNEKVTVWLTIIHIKWRHKKSGCKSNLKRKSNPIIIKAK